MKTSFVNLIVICCILLSLVLACDSEHPSGATLEENFYKYEADLDLLAQLAIEDAAMIRIAPDFTVSAR